MIFERALAFAKGWPDYSKVWIDDQLWQELYEWLKADSRVFVDPPMWPCYAIRVRNVTFLQQRYRDQQRHP